jgi:hypothetical protein
MFFSWIFYVCALVNKRGEGTGEREEGRGKRIMRAKLVEN